MARSVRQAEAKVAFDASKVAPARPFLVLMTEAGREVVLYCRCKFIIASVRFKAFQNIHKTTRSRNVQTYICGQIVFVLFVAVHSLAVSGKRTRVLAEGRIYQRCARHVGGWRADAPCVPLKCFSITLDVYCNKHSTFRTIIQNFSAGSLKPWWIWELACEHEDG